MSVHAPILSGVHGSPHTYEIWLPVVGCQGYEVSSLGQVRSYRSRNGRGALTEHFFILKPNKLSGKNYLRYGLRVGDKTITRRAHHLVLEAFVGPCPPGHQGCHSDDDQANNRLDNLYWGTHAQNVADKVRNDKQPRGSRIGRASIDEEKAAALKRRIAAAPQVKGALVQIANEEGVSRSVIYDLKMGRTWRHVCP